MSPREAGEVCGAGCREPGRETCTCILAPFHDGLHWCAGRNHIAHGWDLILPTPIESPRQDPVAELVQCPACGSVFNAVTATKGREAKVASPEEVRTMLEARGALEPRVFEPTEPARPDA